MSIDLFFSVLALVFSVIALIIVSTKRRVVINEPPKHQHFWVNTEVHTITNNRRFHGQIVGYTYIDRCRDCGEIKHYNVGMD